MCILGVDLNKVNLHDVNFDENDIETSIHIKYTLCVIDLSKVKRLKKIQAQNYPKKW